MRDYKAHVTFYKNYTGNKFSIRGEIQRIKNNLIQIIPLNDKDYQEIQKLENELAHIMGGNKDLSGTLDEKGKEKINKLSQKLLDKQQAYDKKQEIYKNSLEWRIEFPEILDNQGNFLGFDAVIGNPPYGVEIPKSVIKTIDTKKNFSDSSEIFILLSEYLLKEKGLFSFIIPKSILFANNWKNSRNILFNNEILKLNRYRNIF